MLLVLKKTSTPDTLPNNKLLSTWLPAILETATTLPGLESTFCRSETTVCDRVFAGGS